MVPGHWSIGKRERTNGRPHCRAKGHSGAVLGIVARSTISPQTRAALLIMAQKLYDMARNRPLDFEVVQREFNDQQMLPPRVKP